MFACHRNVAHARRHLGGFSTRFTKSLHLLWNARPEALLNNEPRAAHVDDGFLNVNRRKIKIGCRAKPDMPCKVSLTCPARPELHAL